jgi:hypothetical protein
MGLLASVYYFVATKSRRLPETFAAYFAYKWPDASVHRHMPSEIVVGIEDFTTLSAWIVFSFVI